MAVGYERAGTIIERTGLVAMPEQVKSALGSQLSEKLRSIQAELAAKTSELKSSWQRAQQLVLQQMQSGMHGGISGAGNASASAFLQQQAKLQAEHEALVPLQTAQLRKQAQAVMIDRAHAGAGAISRACLDDVARAVASLLPGVTVEVVMMAQEAAGSRAQGAAGPWGVHLQPPFSTMSAPAPAAVSLAAMPAPAPAAVEKLPGLRIAWE
jgi:hypothetical protein